MEMIQPYSQEAEESVLGAMLLDKQAADIVFATGLSPKDFYNTNCSKIFGLLAELADEGIPTDFTNLINKLKSTNQLEKVGGSYYITGLPESVPTTANAESYAKIIQDKADKRRLIKIAQQAVKDAFEDRDSTRDLIAGVERSVFELARGAIKDGFTPYGELLDNVSEELDRTHSQANFSGGLYTGFYDLDDKMAGLHNGDVIILAARPSMGKTAMALNISAHVSKEVPVAIFSLEMTKIELAKRLLLSEAGVDSQKARTGKLAKADFEKILQASGETFEIFIDDNMDLTLLEMRAKARRIKSERNIGLVVVDYLQLINAGKVDRQFSNRNDELSYISRQMKAMAKELNVPVLVLSQLSRGLMQRSDKRPQLSDLRDSGAIEQDADVVIFIHREEQFNPDVEHRGKAEIIIGKQRNGPTGTVDLVWRESCTRFENYSTYDGVGFGF